MTFVKNRSYPTNWSTIAKVFGQLWYRQIVKMNFANNVSPTLSLLQLTRFTSPNQHAKHWSQQENSS